jgi:WD40 repeat protein/serine/threonine protein kinase
MFERFTEKAIQVVILAQEEARRLGHNFVGTEQIIIGLIAEETGIAAKVLTEMGVKLDDAQIEVEKIIGRGSGEVGEEIPFTSRAKRVLELSLQEAEQLGHEYVGTEHLLLGLIREGEGVAIRVLENLRIKPPKVRTSVLRMLADEAEKYEEQLLASQQLDNDVSGENNSPQPDSNFGEEENLQPELASNIYAGLSVDPSSIVQAEVEVPDEWKVGDRLLNLYEVTGILGTGGFGKVYKVLHTGWNISLAVKTPKPEQLEAIGGVENFIQEAETWVKLGLHPHTVTCFYVRKLGKSPRVFAEFVGGGSLHDWIYGRDGEPPKLYQGGQAESFKRILDIAIQFAWGLHYAHEQGLIHQDVKPGNTMMTADGTVKVTDFGLARARPITVSTTENAPDQTLQAEGRLSTPCYRSPEQVKEGAIVTRRTDIYSWAVSVLAMFKGEGRWLGELVAQQRQDYLNLEPLHDYAPPITESVAQLLWVCLREDPERRPRTMLDVANALKVIYQQEMGEAYPRPEPEAGKDIADSLNNRAVSLLDLGQIEEAMHLWDRALEVNPLHPESTYNRGLILWRGCRITDDILVKDLEKLRDANVENWNAHYLLALVHLERNNCEEAIKSLNQIPGELAQQLEVQEALVLAKERLPNSNRFQKELEEWGITSAAVSVCITPDGQYGLSTFYEDIEGDSTNAYRALWENHKFYIWDLKVGRVSKSFKLLSRYSPPIAGSFAFRSLSLSKDGRYVLVTGYPMSSGAFHELWNIQEGKFIKLFKDNDLHERYEASHVGHLSADGRFVVSGNYNGTIELWDIEARELRSTFVGHDRCVNSIASLPEGKFILSGSEDKTLKLWCVARGNCLQTFSDHTRAVQSVCLSGDGKLALSGSSDNTLKLWDTSTGECLRTFIGHTNSVQSVYFSPDDKFAFSASLDATLRLWDVATGRCLHTFIGHEKAIFSICLSADGRIALSGSLDTTIRMWSIGYPSPSYFAPIRLCQVIETERLIIINRAYQQELAAAKISLAKGDMESYAQHIANARTIPASEKNEELFKLWTHLYRYFSRHSLKNAWEDSIFVEHGSYRVTSINCSFDGRLVLSASADGKILLWNLESKQIVREFKGHEIGDITAYLSRDAKYILSGSFDKTLKLWDVDTGECIRTLNGHTDGITSLCWTSDTRFALSGSIDGTIRLWDVHTGRCLRVNKRHGNNVYSLCLSPDEQYYLSANRQVKVWKLSTGNYITNYIDNDNYTIYSICLSHNTEYLLLAKEKGILNLLNVKTGTTKIEFKGHTATVTSVCFSSDSKYILSGSRDNTVCLWDVETGKCLRVFEGNVDGIRAVCFSPDTKYVLSGSFNGEIKIWSLDWELKKHDPENYYLEIYDFLVNFLILNTPYASQLPIDKELNDKEITQTLTRIPQYPDEQDIKDGAYLMAGTLKNEEDNDAFLRLDSRKFWTEQEFKNLLNSLSLASYGLLKPKTIHRYLLANVGMFYQLGIHSSIFLELKNIKEEIKFKTARVITFFVTIYLLKYYIFLGWLVSIIISSVIVYKFPILSAPISLVVAPVFFIFIYITPRIADWLLMIAKTIYKFYTFLFNKIILQTSFIYFYALVFYTIIDWLNFAAWRAFFLSIIPAIILSDRVDRLFSGQDILSKDARATFGIVYILILAVFKGVLNFGWVTSYWLSIPLAIVFSISFWKIFYKLVKPTRKS